MKESDVVVGIGKHAIKWGADELATTNDGDFGIGELNIVAR